MKPWGIEARVLITTLLPTGLLALILIAYYTHGKAPTLAGGIVLGLGVLALSAGMAVHSGRRIARPIREVAHALERISPGDLAVRPDATAPGDLGRLQRGVASLADEIHASQSCLEGRVQEATRELQTTLRELEQRNDELNEARLVAEAASEFKSRFLANISHEIRTPMNSILGFAELLRDAELDTVHADYVDTIHQSARSLLSLLNGILDLSKIESGHMELEPVELDINDILGELFRLLSPEAFRKGVEMVVLPTPPDHARVSADPIRLKQVLLNLASNAVKFTDSGYVLVSPTTRQSGDGCVDFTIRIEDTGCGISREGRERLFEAFAQGDTANKGRRQGGTGLGLHIASELIFLMQGDVEFDSEPGKGSVFNVSLRLPAADVPNPPRRHASFLTGRILVVERDPRIRGMLAQLFHACGAQCKPLNSAHAAARAARPDDIVVIHIPAATTRSGRIPEMHWALPRTGATVVAYSHAHDARTREAISRAGYHAVMFKTADPDILRQDLERVACLDASGVPARTPVEPGGAESTATAAGRALVVDDHPVNRKLLASYLEKECAEVRLAESGTEAVRRAMQESFDVILLDLHLPDMHGTDVAHRIRSNPGPNLHVPLIAITADTLAMHDGRLAACGVTDLLIKPVRRRELIERIARHVGSRSQALAGSSVGRQGHDSGSRRRISDQTPMVNDLRAMLQRDLPESRTAIAAALDGGDAEALGTFVHRLRGAVVYCDVPALQAELERVERSLQAGDRWSHLVPLVEQLLRTIDLTVTDQRRDTS